MPYALFCFFFLCSFLFLLAFSFFFLADSIWLVVKCENDIITQVSQSCMTFLPFLFFFFFWLTDLCGRIALVNDTVVSYCTALSCNVCPCHALPVCSIIQIVCAFSFIMFLFFLPMYFFIMLFS